MTKELESSKFVFCKDKIKYVENEKKIEEIKKQIKKEV